MSRGNMFRMCRIRIISYTQLMNLSDEMSRAEYSWKNLSIELYLLVDFYGISLNRPYNL